MHFAIGTTNIPKSRAIEHVLTTSPYTVGATWSNHKVVSGVPDMPTTLEELRNGAKNRARNTRGENLAADYFVGMEGGVYRDSIGDEYWYMGVVYIEDKREKGYYGYSSHLRVPDSVVEKLFDGQSLDLEEIMYELTGEKNVGDKEGSGYVWSDGQIRRSEKFAHATLAALVPHFSKFYK